MTLNEYQQRAMTTCLPESENFAYMMLNLAGEVGEIAGKVSKYIRKGYANIDEMLRLARGIVFYNVQMITGNKWAVLKILGKYADRIREVLIWDKITSEPAMHAGCLNSEYELIIAFDKADCKGRQFRTANFERGTMANVIRIGKNRENDHRAAFPLLLPQTLIHYFTNEGDIIADPFMGSGTTAVAAKELGVHYIGYELNERFWNIANERLQGISKIEKQAKEDGLLPLF
jgi:DNA modification methylase